MLVGAGLVGVAVRVGSAVATPEGRDQIAQTVGELSILSGLARERSPQEGDDWARCDDARAASTAPIYRGEPGYREGLDADNDGIACEPYRG